MSLEKDCFDPAISKWDFFNKAPKGLQQFYFAA